MWYLLSLSIFWTDSNQTTDCISFSIKIHQIQSDFALFLGEGTGSHETQASLEPAMWPRLALILLPPAPKLQDHMHVYLCSASNSGFFLKKSVLNMWQSQVTAIFNEILEQSVHSVKKPDFSQKLIRPHREAPMHSFHTDTHQKCSCSGPILVTYLCFHLGTRPVIGWKLQEASLFKVNSAQGQTTVCVAKDDLDLVNFLSLPPR